MSSPAYMKACTAALLALAALPIGTASARGIPYGKAFPWDGCFQQVGDYYRISPLLLRAIAWQESSMKPSAIGRNPNPAMRGEYGIGLMQISSWHLPKLRAMGVSEEMLLNNVCLNITVGAWILADNVGRHGLTWEAVGRYNATTNWKKRDYAAKIQRHLLGELRAASAGQAQGLVTPGTNTQVATVQQGRGGHD